MMRRDWITIALGLAVVFTLMGASSDTDLPLVPAPSVTLCRAMPPPCTDNAPVRCVWDIDHWEVTTQVILH